MAVVKACKGGASLAQGLDYIDKKAELRSGINCSDEKYLARQQMQDTKEEHGKTTGRQYKHFVQSFFPGEVNQETAHAIGKEFAGKAWGEKGYEVYMATHADKGHIHNHFIINSVNMEKGIKYHEPKNALETLKTLSDEICIERDLNIIDRTKTRQLDGEIRTYNNDKYRILEKAFEGTAKSYVLETAKAVRDAQAHATSREDFISNMKEKGYNTEWQDHKKNITFTDKDGKKVRLSNLEKTFNSEKFNKDMILKNFDKNKELSKAFENIDLSKEKVFGTQVTQEVKQELTKEELAKQKEIDQNLKKLSDFNKKLQQQSKSKTVEKSIEISRGRGFSR